MSFGNAWTELNLRQGKVLVSGPNGGGKCVDPDTTFINVSIDDPLVKKLFIEFCSKDEK